jgi:predicted  nucleic acid-binding Zn-ribbon protein
MPHQCTTCGQSFADGSKEMLSGCPECGGNKFQYIPSDALTDTGAPSQSRPEDKPDHDPDDSSVTEAVGRAATTVRDYVSRQRTDETPAVESQTDAESMPPEADDEDSAQASARGDIVDPSDLPAGENRADHPADPSTAADVEAPSGSTDVEEPSDTADIEEPPGSSDAEKPPGEGRVVKKPDSQESLDRPQLEELRQELNEQFESIRIVAPGQYELNLMELYDREEHIIALQEDGRYIIEVPDTWRGEE